MKWQPMATTPRDGTPINVYCGGIDTDVVYFDRGMGWMLDWREIETMEEGEMLCWHPLLPIPTPEELAEMGVE